MGGERVNGWEKGRGEMEKLGLNRLGVQWGGVGVVGVNGWGVNERMGWNE